MPSEKEKFQQDLLESVRQMRAGQAGRVTKIHLSSGAPVTVDISLQLATDVIERWKASGPDWQLRMAKLLTEGTP